MRITADTNLLVRAAAADDPVQSAAAAATLRAAELVAVSTAVLCEFCWVMLRAYGHSPAEVAQAIRALVAAGTTRVDRAAVEAGLTMLEAGGDFADGAIAADGARLGGEVFVSFDRQAVRLLKRTGVAARAPR